MYSFETDTSGQRDPIRATDRRVVLNVLAALEDTFSYDVSRYDVVAKRIGSLLKIKLSGEKVVVSYEILDLELEQEVHDVLAHHNGDVDIQLKV